jgi:hypothetical protein
MEMELTHSLILNGRVNNIIGQSNDNNNNNDELSGIGNSFNYRCFIKNIKIINCYSFYLVTILQWHYAF